MLAELADDRVTGCVARRAGPPRSCGGSGSSSSSAGDRSLLKAATRLLAAQGVEVSEVQRKVERVLGDRVPRRHG